MIETGAKEVAEEKIFKAFLEGQKAIDQIVAFIKNIQKEIGKPKTEAILIAPDENFKKEILEKFSEKIPAGSLSKRPRCPNKTAKRTFCRSCRICERKISRGSNDRKKSWLLSSLTPRWKEFSKKNVLGKGRTAGRKKTR